MHGEFSWRGATGYVVCHVYDDRPPILTAGNPTTGLTISAGDGYGVTAEHLSFARDLADKARRYADECERFAVQPAGEVIPGAA
ncbi:MAG: hypothetical protein GEV09_20365 [Pseudonocardiaceae bacterium]|nr:hypothetical protein [Pseudonocardiaceae bacterium]